MNAAAARSTGGQLLDALRVYGPLARVELAEKLDLSGATVTAATAELIEAGWIEVDEAPDVGGPRRGRPRVRLRLRPDAAYVAGVKLSLHQISVAVTNFVGDVLTAEIKPVAVSDLPPEHVAELVRDALDEALWSLGLDRRELAGVGIGAPGFIDSRAGVSHWSPVFNTDHVPIRAMFEPLLGAPVHVDNDANLATLAEQWFGIGRGVGAFVVVTIEHGVGMGAVVGGQLWRGGRGFGGEFGHTKISRGDALCRCGQRGCIEAYLADYAVLREASVFDRAAAAAADPIARRHAVDGLIAAGLAGDRRILDVYARVGETLGVGLANLANIFDPELMIVCGEDAKAAPLFEQTMRSAFAANTVSVAQGGARLEVRFATDVSWAQGAAALVLRRAPDAAPSTRRLRTAAGE